MTSELVAVNGGHSVSVTLHEIRLAIEFADSVNETVDIQKRIAVLLEMARIADMTFEQLYEIGVERLNAMRKGGKIALGLERFKNQWNAPELGSGALSEYQIAVADSNITERTIQKWQKAARISDSLYDEYLDDCLEKSVEPTLAGVLRYAYPHVANNSGENEWYTPSRYIDAAREVMGDIDLDPASSELANEVVQADKIYTIEDNGLDYQWRGKVWMNPPYDKELIPVFVDKLVGHVIAGDITESIVLVNNATETAWFRKLVSVASAVAFSYSRVKYWRPDGEMNTPLQGQAFVYIGSKPKTFKSVFSDIGWIAFVENES